MFDRVCREHDIEHRFTMPNHPWTNGQVERMNRSLKEATVRRYHYATHRQLEDHLAAVPRCLKLRKAIEDITRPHPLRGDLQGLGRPARSLQIRSNPPHVGTET